MSDAGGHIFLSHGSDDKAEANEITRYLEERGLTVWIAPRDVRPGVDYSEALQEAIEASTAFIVLVTEKANKSPYVRVETEMAFSLHKPIFPVRTGDVKPGPGLALFLKIRHWTDAYGPQSEDSMARLARELRSIAGLPETEATAPAQVPGEAVPLHAAPAPPPPPSATNAGISGAGASEDELLLRAFVGPNAEYYLGRWRRPGGGGWHWPAFFINVIWLAYRKMWGLAAAFFAGIMLMVLLSSLMPALAAVLPLPLIGAAVWLALGANRLYRREADKRLAAAGVDRLDRPAALDRARQVGGVSVPAMLGVIAALIVFQFAIMFTLLPRTVALEPSPVQPPLPQADPGGEQPPEQPPQPQPQAQPQPGEQGPDGDIQYTPPDEPVDQQDPPTEGYYDPPQ